jgi:hypothetical protein
MRREEANLAIRKFIYDANDRSGSHNWKIPSVSGTVTWQLSLPEPGLVLSKQRECIRLTLRASNDMTLVQSKSAQDINQPLVIHRLHIPALLIQIP